MDLTFKATGIRIHRVVRQQKHSRRFDQEDYTVVSSCGSRQKIHTRS